MANLITLQEYKDFSGIAGLSQDAKINVIIPEPNEDYLVENSRQTNFGIDTLITQLNTSYKQDIKDEIEQFNWFIA